MACLAGLVDQMSLEVWLLMAPALALAPAVAPVLEEVRPGREGIVRLAQGQDACGEAEAPSLHFVHDHVYVLPDEGKGPRGRQTRDQQWRSPAPSGSYASAARENRRCLKTSVRITETASRP